MADHALIRDGRVVNVIVVDESRPDWPDTKAALEADHDQVVAIDTLVSVHDDDQPVGIHWHQREGGWGRHAPWDVPEPNHDWVWSDADHDWHQEPVDAEQG